MLIRESTGYLEFEGEITNGVRILLSAWRQGEFIGRFCCSLCVPDGKYTSEDFGNHFGRANRFSEVILVTQLHLLPKQISWNEQEILSSQIVSTHQSCMIIHFQQDHET